MKAFINKIMGKVAESIHAFSGNTGPHSQALRQWFSDAIALTPQEARRIAVIDAICVAHTMRYFGMPKDRANEVVAEWLLKPGTVYYPPDRDPSALFEPGMLSEPIIDYVRTRGEEQSAIMQVFISFLEVLGYMSIQAKIDRASDMTVAAVQTFKALDEEDRKREQSNNGSGARTGDNGVPNETNGAKDKGGTTPEILNS